MQQPRRHAPDKWRRPGRRAPPPARQPRGFGELLPILDTGEALVVGDAVLLPTRIRIAKPKNEPLSGTIDFWDRWSEDDSGSDLIKAVETWRRQSVPAES